MFKTLELYVALFFIYSFCGWVIETTRVSFKQKKFVNRGFLVGPICPIYGYGALIITIFLKDVVDVPVEVFFLAVLLCGLLEYLTSYFMEKIFKARWWDYSDRKFNINGRVCADNLFLFGLASCAITYISNPILITFINDIPEMVLNVVLSIIFVIYIVDNVVSYKIILNIKQVSKEIKDNTVEISEKVKKIIHSKSHLHRRILNAYPNIREKLEYGKWTIKEKLEETREKIGEAKKDVQNKIEGKKEAVHTKLEEQKEAIGEKKENLEKKIKNFKEKDK